MKILAISVDPAAPPIAGADLRNWQNVLALSKLGRVTAASLRPLHLGAAMAGHPNVELVALTENGEARTPAIARRTTPIDVRIPKSALIKLKLLVERQQPDIVVVEGISLFPLMKHLRSSARTLILDMHNVESDLVKDIASGPSFRHIFLSNTWRLRRRERKAARMVDQIWVCSSDDHERVRNLVDAQTPTYIVPNGLPRPDCCVEPALISRGPIGPPRILFVGHLGYSPNKEAVRRLAREILPRVKMQFPDARLTVAGRLPDAPISQLARECDVELIANPDDIAPLYAQANLSVVPLSSGGGTRIKILEAMTFGLPVIATTVAAEGHNFANGEEILIADTDGEIARDICALSSDPERYDMQRRRAFEAVHRRFGPAVIDNAVRQALSHRHVF
jgi:glycosyltransferase involved in cell wall biosynthesis